MSSRKNFKEQKQCSLAKTLKAEYDYLMIRIFDQNLIPQNFPRHLLAELYIARTILFASFTLGIRVGGLHVIYFPLREIFGYILVNLFTFIGLPIAGINIAVLHNRKQINVPEFRVLITIWAFLCGTLFSVCNIHYSKADYGTPTYFMPVFIGLTIFGCGTCFYNNRKMLVGVSVGSSVMVSFILLLVTGHLSFGSLFALTLSALNAAIALQLMIYDLIEDGANTNVSFTHVFGVILVMFNMLIVTRLTATYTEDPSRNNLASSTPLHSAFSA